MKVGIQHLWIGAWDSRGVRGDYAAVSLFLYKSAQVYRRDLVEVKENELG